MLSKADIPTFIRWWRAFNSLSYTELHRVIVIWAVLAVIVCLPFYPNLPWKYLFDPRTTPALLAAVGIVLLIRQRRNVRLVFRLMFSSGDATQPMVESALGVIQEARDAALCFGGLIALCGVVWALIQIDDLLQLPRLFAIAVSGAFQGVLLSELVLAPVQKLLGRRAPKAAVSTAPLWRGVYILVVVVGLSIYIWGTITGAFVMGIERPSYPPFGPTVVDKGTLKYCYFVPDGRLVYGGRTPGVDKVLLGDTKRRLLGHLVQNGKNMVLMYRVLMHKRFVVDDTESAKLTVEMPDFHGAGTYTLPSKAVKAYYTHSNIDWGPNALAVESDAVHGTIRIWDVYKSGPPRAQYFTFKAAIDIVKGEYKIKEKELEFEVLPGPLDADDWVNGTRIRPWMWEN